MDTTWISAWETAKDGKVSLVARRKKWRPVVLVLLPLHYLAVAFVFCRPFDRCGSAGAWPAPVYRNMVYDTLRIMPPSLGRVLWRNDEHLLRGVYRLEGGTAST